MKWATSDDGVWLIPEDHDDISRLDDLVLNRVINDDGGFQWDYGGDVYGHDGWPVGCAVLFLLFR